MIEQWLVAVRDHPDRPPMAQRHVLAMLALRVDWRTGRGFASTGQLAADSGAEERTIRRATGWGRDTGLLLRTRRGHRLGNGRVTASEWQLTQPVTGDLLTKSQPANGHASTGLQHSTIKSPLHQESNARASAAQGQDQNQGPDSIRVGNLVSGKEGSGLDRSAANSHRPRVHHGSKDPASDDQQIPIPVTHQSQAADRNAREAAP